MKYVFDLMFSMATGKYWPTAMDPIAPALADMLIPFARTCVGKIWLISKIHRISWDSHTSVPYTHALGPNPMEYPKEKKNMNTMQT